MKITSWIMKATAEMCGTLSWTSESNKFRQVHVKFKDKEIEFYVDSEYESDRLIGKIDLTGVIM